MPHLEVSVRVLLVPNPMNPRAVEASREVAAYLTSSGYEPVMVTEDAVRCGLGDIGVARADIGDPELVLALGGDGTILKAVHILGLVDAPILGVNLGRLGFLSGADGDDLVDAVTSALAGEARIECRQTIEASVIAGGRDAGSYRALNEIFVGRGAATRAIELEIVVNETPINRYLCDGVVVATPTGSTAYALSAGGPVVAPGVRGIVVVPLAPHALGVRPLVLAPGDVLTLRCPSSARADACVSVDGDHVPCRTALDSVQVTVSEHDVKLMKLGGRDFYSALASTFLGA